MNRFKVRQAYEPAINEGRFSAANDELADEEGENRDPDWDRTSPIRAYIRQILGESRDAFEPNLEEKRAHVRQAPYFFNLINQALRDCYFSKSLEQLILDYSKIFMAQPLPNSLLPLETNRIILNERLMPGITKVLQIMKDFP